MRRLFIFILFLLALVIGAALAAPGLIPQDILRERISSAASQALEREVTLEGDISLRLLPVIEVRAGQASIANAEGFGSAPFAEMSEMRFTLAIGPLFSRRIEIEEFVLVDPVIRLESRGGRNNWTFGEAAQRAPSGASGQGFVRRPGALPFEASFGDVRIQNGTLIYAEQGQQRRFDGLDLSISLPSVDGPVELTGGFSADGRPVRFTAGVGSLRGFFEGANTPLEVSLSGALGTLAFNGAFAESEQLAFEGQVDMDLPIRALARYFGSQLPEGDVFRRFAARSHISGAPGSVSLTGAAVTFDDIRANGALSLDYSRARPMITGELTSASLDITPYIPSENPQASGIGPWSEERIDLTPLTLADARLTIRAQRFKANDIEAENINVAINLTNGVMTTRLTDFGLYGGRGGVTAVVDARRATPSYTFNAEISALQALPFLNAAAGFDRLEGLGAITLDLTANGASPAAIMNSLSGEGRFNFSDGALVGVNLAQVIRTIQTAVTTGQLPSGFAETQQTDFTSLGGTVRIRNGVAENLDLTMLSPLLRVEGAGAVNLAGQNIDYRLTPRAVQTITGQGGDLDLRGLAVPIRLQGGFNNVSVGIDFQSVARDLVRARAGTLIGGQAGQALQGGQSIEDAARGALGGALRDALGRRDAEPAEGGEEGEADDDPAARLIRGILGGRRQPPPEEDNGG